MIYSNLSKQFFYIERWSQKYIICVLRLFYFMRLRKICQRKMYISTMCKLKARVIANCNFIKHVGSTEQCCESRMFIPDPRSRIPDPTFSIPDPGLTRSRIPIRIKKNLNIYNPKKDTKQCCGIGSGSRIPDHGSGAFFTLDPGSVMDKTYGSGMNNPDHISELRKNFLG